MIGNAAWAKARLTSLRATCAELLPEHVVAEHCRSIEGQSKYAVQWLCRFSLLVLRCTEVLEVSLPKYAVSGFQVSCRDTLYKSNELRRLKCIASIETQNFASVHEKSRSFFESRHDAIVQFKGSRI